jgi:Tfp pilus assembly protein PilF
VTFVEEGRFAEAIPYFERAMANLLYTTPQFAEQNLGWSLYKTGKVESGIAHLKNAVTTAPDLCGGYYYLGVAHAEQGVLDEATRWFETYREKCDGTTLTRFVPPTQLAEVQYRLGMAYLKRGDPERARVSWEDCLGRFPKAPAAAECQKSLAVLP